MTATPAMGTASIHLFFHVAPMINFSRQKHLSIADAGKSRHRTSFIDANGHFLYMLLTVPEKFDSKGRPFDNLCPFVPKEFSGFCRFTRHQRMTILIDHIHKYVSHNVRFSSRSEMLLANVQDGFYRKHTSSFRSPLMPSHRAEGWNNTPRCATHLERLHAEAVARW
jgi:hypothetical protein